MKFLFRFQLAQGEEGKKTKDKSGTNVCLLKKQNDSNTDF